MAAVSEKSKQERTERTKARHEDAEYLLRMGEHPERVARRVGVSIETLKKWREQKLVKA